jgi:hypothetical protein
MEAARSLRIVIDGEQTAAARLPMKSSKGRTAGNRLGCNGGPETGNVAGYKLIFNFVIGCCGLRTWSAAAFLHLPSA